MIDEIKNFIETDVRFENTGIGRVWRIYKDNNTIGSIWFKHALGGWRLILSTDKDREWEERGIIESVSQLKKHINHYYTEI